MKNISLNNLHILSITCFFTSSPFTSLFFFQACLVASFLCKSESENRSVVSDSSKPHGLYSPWNSPGQNTEVGSLSLRQGIFSTQGSNPSLPHCRQNLYQLNHKGSPLCKEQPFHFNNLYL